MDIVSGVFSIVMQTPSYACLTVAQVRDGILAAADHDRMVLWWDEQGIYAFMTYAFLTPDQAKQFKSQKWFPVCDDFAQTEGEPWVVDFVMIRGNCGTVVRQMRDYLAQRHGAGLRFNWKRGRRHSFKLGYALTKGSLDVAA